MEREILIGVDIGGTFTDLVAIDAKSGQILENLKTPSTPRSPQIAFVELVEKIYERKLGKVEAILHATTIATNALLGQVGLELPKCALITTKGFRDVIEIGRQKRPELYNFFFRKPKVLIDRELRFEVNERLDPSGKVLKPLEPDEVLEIAKKLKALNIESVAVSLLHSYINPKHEKMIEKLLKSENGDLEISISSEVNPEYREYERTSTTVVNAVLVPIVKRYLNAIREELDKIGVNSPILIMQSNGGLTSTKFASKFPFTIIESGPAAGIIASKYIGELKNEPNIIGFDMGGTTAKAGAIVNYRESVTSEYEVGGKVHSGRIIKGSGYPVRFPFIDLSEISAGGGSIIWVDEGGALRVGPISAGADPGPAAYNKGGENPTLTDANIVLGRLNPEFLLGGKMKIYRNLSIKAFKEKIEDEIGLDPVEASIGAIKIANNSMAKVLRIITMERGLDPRDFTIVAYGGAGPMHICEIAQELDIRRNIVPLSPGTFSALGLLVTDVKHSLLRAIRKNIDDVDVESLEEAYVELEGKAYKILKSEGFKDDSIMIHRMADLKYWAQGYELTVDSYKPLDMDALRRTVKNFESEHESIYGYIIEDEAIELVNIRVDAYGIRKKPLLQKKKKRSQGSVEDALIGRRQAYFEELEDFEETPIYDRSKLFPMDEIVGPAIIEQYDSTTVVPPRFSIKVDEFGFLILERD
ncbi:MAG: hydantoinase/oxoprolinase family protein [Candidatus Njordarchaeia archaeon]